MNNKQVNLNSIEIEDIDTNDYPDFVDAFVVYAEWDDGTEMTDREIVENIDGNTLYDLILERVF